MVEIDVRDIVERLKDLHVYSPGLAARRPNEKHLPEDPALALCIRLEYAFDRVESAELADRAEAFRELEKWLEHSYRYYMSRLTEADNPWSFRFPRMPQCTHAAVFTQQ